MCGVFFYYYYLKKNFWGGGQAHVGCVGTRRERIYSPAVNACQQQQLLLASAFLLLALWTVTVAAVWQSGDLITEVSLAETVIHSAG